MEEVEELSLVVEAPIVTAVVEGEERRRCSDSLALKYSCDALPEAPGAVLVVVEKGIGVVAEVPLTYRWCNRSVHY